MNTKYNPIKYIEDSIYNGKAEEDTRKVLAELPVIPLGSDGKTQGIATAQNLMAGAMVLGDIKVIDEAKRLLKSAYRDAELGGTYTVNDRVKSFMRRIDRIIDETLPGRGKK